MSTDLVTVNATLTGMEDLAPESRNRARRRALGLTQAELAQKSGVSEKSIRNLERGDQPGMEKTARLVDATLDRLERVGGNGGSPATHTTGPSDPATAALIKMTLDIGQPDNMHAENYEGALRVMYWVRPEWMPEARFAEIIADAERARNRRQGDDRA